MFVGTNYSFYLFYSSDQNKNKRCICVRHTKVSKNEKCIYQ